jgi:cell division protein FtsI (penicillin-binding protein 3)
MARFTLTPAGVGAPPRLRPVSTSTGIITQGPLERRAIVRRPRSESASATQGSARDSSRNQHGGRTGGPQRGSKPPRRPKRRPERHDDTGRVTRTRHGLLTRRPFRHYRGITLVWLVVFGVMALQIFSLQVRNRTSLVALSKKQRTHTIALAAERGDLLDRFHVPLAISVREWRLIGDPKTAAADTVNTAELLAPVIGFNPEWIKARLQRTGRYVVLARGLDDDMATKIRALKLRAISLEPEQNRIYPSGDLARSVLGRVNRASGIGETGFEKLYEPNLKGEPGELLVERNARGQQIPAGLNRTIPAENGTNIVLTLDSSLTYALEGMTAQAVASTGAKSGMTAIADISSGDVVALSNMRTNAEGQVFPAEDNSALVSVYEPGSVAKIITIAAALENNVVDPNTRFNVPDRMQVSDHNFKDDEPHKEAMLTPGEILTNSSNIGTIKIAQLLGRKQIDRYMRGFGLGLKTGINFPGESAGILPPLKQWTGTSIGTVPIGQGLAVTALQMLGVYTTIANKGVRVPLHLVHSTIDKNGVERKLKIADPVRVISEQTAGQVKDMLESVVLSGTGKKAQVKGYRVAGKTGTAQKPNLHSRGYNPDAYVASFIGFFPAENPRFAILCLLDEPKTSIYGGATAAPLFAEIAHFLGQHYRVPPSTGSEVTTEQITAAADSSITLGATREMRAVAQAGSWQQAEIRKAATLGVAGVVANATANATDNATDNATGTEAAQTGATNPSSAVAAPDALRAVQQPVSPPGAPAIVTNVPLANGAPIGQATPAAVAPQVPTLSPFAVATAAPAVAVVPVAPTLAAPPTAINTAPNSALNAPTVGQNNTVGGVPTVTPIPAAGSTQGVPTVDLGVPLANAQPVAGNSGQVVQGQVVQGQPLPGQVLQQGPVQAVAKQPPVTVPDLSTWRKSGKSVARAQVLATAVAPTTIPRMATDPATSVETTAKAGTASTGAKAPSGKAAKPLSSAVVKRTTNP